MNTVGDMKWLERAEYRGGHRLWLEFTDGEQFELDFWPKVAWGPVMVPLQDTANFAAFELDNRGRSIEWPQFDVGFCADSLWLDGHPEELAKVEAAAAAAQAAREREAVPAR